MFWTTSSRSGGSVSNHGWVAGQYDSFMSSSLGRGIQRYRAGSIHRAGKRWVTDFLGTSKSLQGPGAMNFLQRWFGRGFLAYGAYQGYQKGGIGGAVKHMATDIGFTYALGAGLKTVGLAAGGLGMAAGVGLGLGAMGIGAHIARGGSPGIMVRPWLHDYKKKHATLEMGMPAIDQFGTMASMRQRSLNAIQNSRINGRSALGNEALMTYTPYFR